MLQEPIFQPFNPDGEVRVYVRNLPHWRQPGVTYFVTFRQDDSIPVKVLAQWLDIRQRWYRANGLDPKWQDSEPDRFDADYRRIPAGVRRAFERQQARLLHEELDRCHGSCVLRHSDPQIALSDSLRFFHRQRLWLGDFVIMPNHVHALFVPFSGPDSESQATGSQATGWELEDLLGSIKKWTSRLIGNWLAEQPEALRPVGSEHNKARFWQHESYDRIVRDTEELAKFRRYISENPAAAKVQVGDYVYHAAEWLDAFAPRPVV
jgi:putative transposase